MMLVDVIAHPNTVALRKSRSKLRGIRPRVIKNEFRWFHVSSFSDNANFDGRHLVNGIMIDITESKRNELSLKTHHERLAKLNRKIISLDDNYRSRISEFLHDEIGQDIAAALFIINQSVEQSQNTEAPLRHATSILNSLISKTRSVSRDLNPIHIKHSDLKNAIHQLIKNIAKKHKHQIDVTFSELNTAIDPETQCLIYKCISELTSNIIKHAQATEIQINVSVKHDSFIVDVSDNGIGISENGNQGDDTEGLGLFMVEERLRQHGGTLDISNDQHRGTLARLTIPRG